MQDLRAEEAIILVDVKKVIQKYWQMTKPKEF